MEQITSSRSFAGIFPPALRSLWSPITPSSQAKSARRLTALTVTFIIKQALRMRVRRSILDSARGHRWIVSAHWLGCRRDSRDSHSMCV